MSVFLREMQSPASDQSLGLQGEQAECGSGAGTQLCWRQLVGVLRHKKYLKAALHSTNVSFGTNGV